MNTFDQLRQQVDDWLDATDRERDVAMRMMQRRGRTDEIDAWLSRLESDREKHLRLLDILRGIEREHYPALVLSKRPPVKAVLRAKHLRRAMA